MSETTNIAKGFEKPAPKLTKEQSKSKRDDYRKNATDLLKSGQFVRKSNGRLNAAEQARLILLMMHENGLIEEPTYANAQEIRLLIHAMSNLSALNQGWEKKGIIVSVDEYEED